MPYSEEYQKSMTYLADDFLVNDDTGPTYSL
jgi:hypothetical protein